MPFHGRRRSSSPGNPQGGSSSSHAAIGGMFQATQTLGSIGAPGALGALTTAGTDSLFFSSDSSTRLNGDAKPSANRRNSEIPNPGAQQSTATATATAMGSASQSFNPSQRGPAFGRQPEELHIPAPHHSLASNDRRQQDQPQILPQPDYSHLPPPSANIQQSTAANHPGNSALPGTLQSGHMSRPGASSTTAATSNLATLSQLSTQPPTTTTPSRSSMNNNHGYSRSSPAGFDHQKYKHVGNTPDSGKYMPPNSAGYQFQTPQASPYSPLGLADIRPHTESGLPEDITGPNVYSSEYSQVPTNSNYLAPWPAYALDWCKWPPSPNSSSAGKIAVGSYLEDNHNFVRIDKFHTFMP